MGIRRYIMKSKVIEVIIAALCIFQSISAMALSTPIGRDINLPKDYDPKKAKAIREVIQDERFEFVDGIVSHWPPDFGTRLSFRGDATALNDFFAALRKLPGIRLKVVLYRGRDDELRRDSAWQLDFSQAHPDRGTIKSG
jgi:hypothetical protein